MDGSTGQGLLRRSMKPHDGVGGGHKDWLEIPRPTGDVDRGPLDTAGGC